MILEKHQYESKFVIESPKDKRKESKDAALNHIIPQIVMNIIKLHHEFKYCATKDKNWLVLIRVENSKFKNPQIVKFR